MNSSINESLLQNIEESIQQQLKNSSPVDFRYFLGRIFYPCLLVWGIIGNGLCLRVLLSKKFSKNSTCQYLAVLAVIDILFIMMRSSRHIYKLYRDSTIFNTSKWICRTLTFFSSALAHMASWILVIVSFDRYWIVTSRYRRHGSPAIRVFCSTLILIVIVVLCNLYYFFILGRTLPLIGSGSSDNKNIPFRLTSTLIEPVPNASNLVPHSPTTLFRFKTSSIFVCIPTSNYETFFRTYIPIFDILLVAVIPFLLLCFTNTGIIIFAMKNNSRNLNNRKSTHRRHQRLTIMLLSVTLAFIGLTCPSVIFICLNKIIYSRRISPDRKQATSENTNIGPPPNIQLIIDLCEALWYTKHAMNFILYTLSGEDFRRAFVELFTRSCRSQRHFMRICFNNIPTIERPTEVTEVSSRCRPTYLLKGKQSKKSIISDIADPSSALFIESHSTALQSLSNEQK